MLSAVLIPLFTVGYALAPTIHHHQGLLAQVVEQRGGLGPGQAHQPAHALGGAAL